MRYLFLLWLSRRLYYNKMLITKLTPKIQTNLPSRLNWSSKLQKLKFVIITLLPDYTYHSALVYPPNPLSSNATSNIWKSECLQLPKRSNLLLPLLQPHPQKIIQTTTLSLQLANHIDLDFKRRFTAQFLLNHTLQLALELGNRLLMEGVFLFEVLGGCC